MKTTLSNNPANVRRRNKLALSKATVEDYIFKKYDDLKSKTLDYPTSVIEEGIKLKNLAVSIYSWNKIGADYSGITTHLYKFGLITNAKTTTSVGARYSRRNTFRRTNAEHCITFAPAELKLLSTIPNIVRETSNNDGLCLIGASEIFENLNERLLKGMATVTWLKEEGKQISSKKGIMTWEFNEELQRLFVYHAINIDAAKSGLKNKIRLAVEKLHSKSKPHPLWKERITLSEVQNLTGWCAPGCRAWLQRLPQGQRSEAPWHVVAKAALEDYGNYYSKRLAELLGASPNGPYTF